VMLFMTILVAVIGAAVFAPGRITYHRILGAVVLYMLIAHVFAGPYQILLLTAPGAFAGLPSDHRGPATVANLLYFSYATLTTTGYGDIAPVHPLARGLANLEAVIGQLYPATLLARIVTLHAEARRP